MTDRPRTWEWCLLLAIACAAPRARAGETCALASPVGLGTNPVSAGAVTDNAPGASCGGYPDTGGVLDAYFAFTPPTTGNYTLETCNAAPGLTDTVLSIYAGPCAAPTQLACNDDGGCGDGGFSSRLVNVPLTAGTPYIIRIAAYDEASLGNGAGVLSISMGDTPPANDLCADALPVGVGASSFENTGASTQGPGATCGSAGSTGWHDVFFRFAAPTSDLFRFDTCATAPGQLEDTVLQVLLTCNGPQAACDDDGCGPSALSSACTLPLAAGQQVWIRVSSWNPDATGTGVLTITPVSQPLTVTALPATAQELSPVVLGAMVTPAASPASTGVAVTADLTPLGAGPQPMFDNGTHGDGVPGDGVYHCSFNLPLSLPAGGYSVPITAHDAQGRSDADAVSLTVTAGPVGACCNAGVCSGLRETQCALAGGLWLGPGVPCGGPIYSTESRAGSFVPLAATGTPLTVVSSCDDCTQTIALPFEFSLYGTTFTSVSVSSNGNLQFDAATPSDEFLNTPIPTPSGPNNALYPAWDDYDPGAGGGVYVQVTGDSPGRVFRISWEGVPEYGLNDTNSFQAILYEGSDVFDFAYGHMDNLPNASADDVTIGVEDATGTLAVSHPAWALDNLTLRWSPDTALNPCTTICDTIDFNHDDLFPDTQDIDDFLAVFSGGVCSNDPGCGDVDFNNDGLFPDTLDIDALLSVFSGGPCLG
ncbi:MAG: choice-of-anchor X domain-containing protein [Phycisphaerales bacterium]